MLPIDKTASNLITSSLPGSASAASPFSGKASSGKASSVKDNYFDQNSLNSVKTMGRHNDPAALKEISKKFESMFVAQMLKSMREANAVFAEGDMFSSDEVKFHQDMMDQQMVLNLTSGEGIGLAKAMYQQMQKSYGKAADENSVNEIPVNGFPLNSTSPSDMLKSLERLPIRAANKSLTSNSNAKEIPEFIARPGNKNSVAKTPEDFVEQVKPYAEKAAADLNISVDVLLAQAALETGWGKFLIHDTKGNNTFNIFNIKATGWQGKSVTVNTLEHKQGVAQQERSAFRQYEGYAQSFADYVALIKNNPRYKEALAAGDDSASYADALQKAGYATDPEYAQKIKRLINSDSIRSATTVDLSSITGVQS
jgi:peptidoglycan hydrolase FlgJ